MEPKLNLMGYKPSGLSMLLELGQPRVGGERMPFYVSNEDLSFAEKILPKFAGIEHYVGICGGGTGDLYLLSKLESELKTVTLVDSSGWQLGNFRELADIYNKSHSEAEYGAHIRHHYKKDKSHTGYDDQTTLGLPKFKALPTIALKHSNIEKYLKNINVKGKYFVYLSNTLWCWWTASEKEAKALVSSICDNPNIEDGSIIVASGSAYPSAIPSDYEQKCPMYLKSNNKLLPISQTDQVISLN